MNLKDIKAKLEEAGVDAGVITAVESLDTSAEVERLSGELDAEKGKNAGILADKKKYKDRADEYELTMKKAEQAKLPEDERHAAELKELKEKIEAGNAEREADKAAFAKSQRDAKIADLTGSVHWAAGTPHDTAKLIISQALSTLDDLSDQVKVDEVLNSVKETHKSFIAAEAPGGSGSKGGTGGKDNGGGGEASNIADNQKAIWGDK